MWILFFITGLLPNGTNCDPLPANLSSAAIPALPTPAPLASVNFRCPEQFGYYADEYNCSKYFVCVFGEALHESCTGGLRFSSELQTCDWPRNVVCPFEGKFHNTHTHTHLTKKKLSFVK